MTPKKSIAVLCDFVLWDAQDNLLDSAPAVAEKINKLYKDGNLIVLVSRRLNTTGLAKGFRADISHLGIEYSEFHDTYGFPRVDELMVGGGKIIKETK